MLAKYTNILNKSQKTILSAALIISVASGINAILGFVKGRLLATYYGDSTELAIFYTADRIPDLIYSVLVVGALSTIFIPVFTTQYKKDKQKAWNTASSMINISLILFGLLALVIYIAAPQVMNLLSVGTFKQDQIALGAKLMRIMLMAQIILLVSSFLTSILQSFKFFLIPAVAPVAYNIGLIVGIIFLSERFGIFGPAYGVIIGAILHLIIQIPVMKHTDFKFKFALNLQKNGTREIFNLMPARIGSVLLNNLITTVNNSLAILIGTSAVVHLKFANQLQFFPVHLFGFSIAHASLPTLSEEGDMENLGLFKRTYITSLHQMMFLVVPASVILLVLRIPIVRIVYGASTFPWEATVKTAYALAFFSLSIFAQAGIYLVTRAFYSLKDTSTPAKISAWSIALNVIMSLWFVKVLGFGVWSVAFAFSISSIGTFIALLILFQKKIGGIDLVEYIKPFAKISWAAVFMGIGLYLPLKLLDKFVFDTTRTVPLIMLTGITAFVGMSIYLLLTWLFKVEEIELFYRLLKKLKIKAGVDIAATTTIGAREEI